MWPFKKKQPEPEAPYKLEPMPEPKPPEPPKRDTTTIKKLLCRVTFVDMKEPLMLDVADTEKLKHEHETQAIGLIQVHPYTQWMDLFKSFAYRMPTTFYEPWHTRACKPLTVNTAMVITIAEPYEFDVLKATEPDVAV